MLGKYPQIKQLMGHDWRIGLQVVVTVLIQLAMAIAVQNLPWKFVWLLTYVISGTLNHSLSISFHESMFIMTSEAMNLIMFTPSWSQSCFRQSSTDSQSNSWLYSKSAIVYTIIGDIQKISYRSSQVDHRLACKFR
jgi:hypothetical protein